MFFGQRDALVFRRFWPFRDKAGCAASEVPPGKRVYAVGDVHGRADLLETLHGQIRHDASESDAEKTIVYIGDYIDRGLQSKQVLDLLIENPLEQFQSVYLLGNHEDALLRFLDDVDEGPCWIAIGGDATALSYGISIPNGLNSMQRMEHLWHGFHARFASATLTLSSTW